MQLPLSNHAFIIMSRWVALACTAALLFWQQRAVELWGVWLILVLLTAALTIAVQPLVRGAVRQPWLMGVDVFLAAAVVVGSDPWNSPFLCYACAVLVLPALVSGWRGGAMAGLLCSALILALMYSLDVSFVSNLPHMWLRWVVIVTGPATIGVVIPAILPRMQVALPRLTSPVWSTLLPLAPSLLDGWWSPFERITPPWRIRKSSQRIATNIAERTEALRVALYQPLADSDDISVIIPELVNRFERHTLIATRVAVLGRPQDLPELYVPLLRRIVIEALLNIAQHTHANEVVVMLRYDARALTVLVHDDGQGLPVTGIHRAGLHSLQALMYRTSELGGRLEVFNHNPAGVAVRVGLPLVVQVML